MYISKRIRRTPALVYGVLPWYNASRTTSLSNEEGLVKPVKATTGAESLYSSGSGSIHFLRVGVSLCLFRWKKAVGGMVKALRGDVSM